MRHTLVILLIAAAIFAGCAKKEEANVKIGIAAPMTGSQAKMGKDFQSGAELAVAEWNQRGGVLGKKIEIVQGDDQADPKQAVSVANKLVNDGVAGVVGHFNSSCSIPASDVYNRASVPMISPGSTNPQLTERGYPGVFRVCGRDDQQGGVAARFVLEQLKLKKVAVLHDKTTYGQGLADEFKRKLGDKVEVVYYGGIIQGDKDFKAVLTDIKTKAPQLIFFGGIYNEGGQIAKQAKEIGLDAPMMSGDGVFDPLYLQIAGDAAEGTFLTFSPDPEKMPSSKAFIERYKAKYGEPGPYSIYAYDAMNIMAAAISAANSTDGKAIIAKLHGMTFDGAMGKIKFDPKGDVTAPPYVVWVVKGGKFQELWRP